VDHEPVDRGPNAGIFLGKGPSDDRAELYIVAEGTTPAGEAFAGHVVSAVGNTWHTVDMSLTGGLRRLFLEAQRNLRDWNKKSIAQHRVSIGLTCFGRRGNQAVIAQAGPSVAYHYSRGEVKAYYTDEEHGRPIGIAGNAEPQLTRINFLAGDRLLLITTPALRELDDEVIGGILSLPVTQVLPDLYHRLSHLRSLTVVMVTPKAEECELPAALEADEPVIDATATTLATVAQVTVPAPELPSNTFQPSLFVGNTDEALSLRDRLRFARLAPRAIADATAMPDVGEIPAPLRRVSGDTAMATIPGEAAAPMFGGRASASFGGGAVESPRWRVSASSGDVPDQRRRTARGGFSRSLVRDEVPPRPSPGLDSVPFVDDMAAGRRQATRSSTAMSETIATENAVSLSNGGSLVRVRGNMGGRWKGNGGLSHRPVHLTQTPPTWMVIVIGLGILLTLVGFLVVPGMMEEQSSQRYLALVSTAQQKIATAGVLQDDAAARRLALTEAQVALLEARAADPGRQDAVELLERVNAELAVMDNIMSPASVETIADLRQFGDKPVAASRLLIGNSNAYILDAAGQVISVSLATGETKVIFAENKELMQGRPIAAAYSAADDAVLIVDASRSLWQFNPAEGLSPVIFNASGLTAITDIAFRDRNLYVLSAEDSTIFQFAPAEGGYGGTPAKILTTPDLAAARRLMVDSEVITMDANGTLRRFSGQVALILSQAGIDKPLAAPEPPQPMPTNDDFAVIDAAGDRIAVFRRDGSFDRQYRHKDFAGITAMAVRDGAGYIFSDGQLRLVTW